MSQSAQPRLLSIDLRQFDATALFTIALAAAGGGIATLLGMPAGWVCGAAIVTAAAALRRWKIAFPQALQGPTYVVLGAAMGSSVSTTTLSELHDWGPTVIAVVAAIVLITAIGQIILVKGFGWERETAFYGSIPGALAYAIALATASRHADVPRVALSQTTRLMALVAVLPLLVTLGFDGAGPMTRPPAPVDLPQLAILLAACFGGLVLAKILKLPAAHLTGPFLISMALHLTGLSDAKVPLFLSTPAYVLMGAQIGVRFSRANPAALLRALFATLVAFVAALALSFVVAMAVTFATGVPLLQTFLAFAPGGIDSMTVLAFALHLDPAYVIVHQVLRFVALTVSLPIVARLLFR